MSLLNKAFTVTGLQKLIHFIEHRRDILKKTVQYVLNKFLTIEERRLHGFRIPDEGILVDKVCRSLRGLSLFCTERKERDPAFAEGYDSGYREFLVGILLREARERAGVTQEELANAIHTKKSVISRLENKASDARVSTPRKVAQALDKELVIELRDRPKQRKRREKATA